ncbi:LacI family transcriptional regulator [Treponema primitia]|uniref:LacI family DNA-binding transcriptional regulator n=1 Tax=Treponema primitia TaxID=88058 RepID=UPI00397F5838
MKSSNPKNLTMEMVALKAGVSITTVSHVINKTRHVNQETKNAVLRVIKELNYRSAKMSKSTRSNEICIGVILADAREDYYNDMIKAIESVAADYGVSIIFCDSEADFEKEEKNIGLLLGRNVNGLLLAPADADRMPKILKNISIPVVLIDRQYESHNFLSVGINNFQSCYQGAGYMIKMGCKNIGFIGYADPVDTIRKRILGYKAALNEFDSAAIPKVLYLKYNGGDSFPLIKQFIIEEGLDGIICATSSLCAETIEVLDPLDAEMQKKINLLSYDDNRWLNYLKYPVSVISQPVAEIGNAAVENLLQLIEQSNYTRDIKRELLFDTTIIDRIANPLTVLPT